jgi:tetratricopeptide (TPR) repeat protein
MSVLETIAQGEERPDLASKYLYTAGVIARDELGDAPRAVELFERALDTDPQRLKAFEAINRLLTQAKEWKRLERAFRKMLHRLTTTPDAQPELLQHLWHSLGVIYRDRMSDFVSAAQAFEQASRFNPDSDTQHCILAELYVRIPGEVQRAIGANLERIDRDATNAAPYRALYEIYRRHLEDDRAWCAAQVLIYLGDVDQELLAFHQRCQQTSRRGGHALTSEDWLRHLYHPDHDRALATIFRCLSEPLHERRYGQSGGSAKKRKKVAASEEALVTTFRSACEVLSTDISPRFVVNALAPHAMRSEGGALPTVTAGRLACERSHRELCFLVGHHLSYYRSEHYIRHLLRSREELGGAFLVAMRSIGKSDGSQDTEQAWAALRRKLAPETIERIQRSCNIFVRRGEPANIKRYIQTTELTACRAGLLLADDLSASMTMVRQLESAGADDLSPNEKALALLKFSISEPYFQLRRRIGVAVSKAGRAWEDGAA